MPVPYFLVSVTLVNYTPSAGALLCLVGCMALMALTQTVRSADDAAANRLMTFLAAPVAAFCLLLAWLAPEASYERHTFSDRLLQLFTGETFESYVQKGSGGAGYMQVAQTVDFSELGYLSQRPVVVMRVTAPQDGLLYLRGTALNVYSQDGWSLEPIDGGNPCYRLTNQVSQEFPSQVQIQTAAVHDVLYLPYYAISVPSDAAAQGDAYWANSAASTAYTVGYVSTSVAAPDLDPLDFLVTDASEEYAQRVMDADLDLPAETARALREIAQAAGISAELSDQSSIFMADGGTGRIYNNAETIANAVADFYQCNGTYTLDPEMVPVGEDFAVWFTRESMEGYCVHFASSAAAMLRALGVPARYVTGYAVRTETGETTNVTERHAHAWVEYYCNGFGWRLLEVTPPDSTAAANPGASEPMQSSRPAPSAQPSAPEAATRPSQTKPEPHDPSAAGNWPYWLVLLPVLGLASLYLRRVLILQRRRRRFAKADNRLRAEMLWSQVLRIAKYTHLTPDKDVEALALRAKYSGRGVAKAELDVLAEYRRKFRRDAYRFLPPPKRMLARWIWII